MKLKTQLKIYQKLVCEHGGKYDGAEEFINIRVKELCSEHGILEEEVRLYMCIYFYAAFTVYPRTQSRVSLFCIKIVLFLSAGLIKS